MSKRRVRETLARKIMGHAAMTRLMAIADRGVTMERTATPLTRRVTLTTGTTTDTNVAKYIVKTGPAQCRPVVFWIRIKSACSPSSEPEAESDKRVIP
jgi:hypothetical protein